MRDKRMSTFEDGQKVPVAFRASDGRSGHNRTLAGPRFPKGSAHAMNNIAVVEWARADGKHQFIDAFPSFENGPSNAICRRVGFTVEEEVDFEYPQDHFMCCNAC